MLKTTAKLWQKYLGKDTLVMLYSAELGNVIQCIMCEYYTMYNMAIPVYSVYSGNVIHNILWQCCINE